MGAASAAIDALYADRLAPGGPGGIAAVVHGGKLVHLAGYGLANLEFGIGWDSRTRYPLASITKTFVALIALGMADTGRWSLDDPVLRYAPDEPLPSGIRLSHLLNMTAGLRHDEVTALMLGSGGDWHNDRLRALGMRLPELHHPPGAFQIYCCANYRWLSHLFERVRNQSFADMVATDILVPLGMEETTVPTDWSAVEPRRACGYVRHADGGWRREAAIGQSSGDGAIVSTARDLLAFIAHLTRHDAPGRRPIERLAAGAPALGLLSPRYAYGLIIDEWRGLPSWGHSGITNTKLAYLPDHDLAVLCLHNDLDLSADDMAYAIAAAVLGAAVPAADDGMALFRPRLGWYADPASGTVLELVDAQGPAVRLLGDRPARMAWRGDGIYEAVRRMSPMRLTLADGERLVLDEITAGIACQRLPDGTPPHHDQAGLYLCRAGGGLATVERVGERLRLRLGAGVEPGQDVALTWAGGDLFHADGTSVRFERQADGTITRLSLSRMRARNLAFERLRERGEAIMTKGRG